MDWLTASDGCEIEGDDRSVSVTCRQNQARLTIVTSPSHDELIVRPYRSFSLEVDDGVEIADDFRLVIIPQTRRTGTCTVRAPIRQIRCGAAVEYPAAAGPVLGLAHSADVEFTGGNWTLDPAYNSARVPVNVVAASGDTQTKLICNLPIGSLRSTGDHSFSLRWTDGTAIKIASGSPTFENPLHRVSVSGAGDVVVKGDVTDSTVDLAGSLRANGDVTGTAIKIGGTLTVTGSMVLDTHELTCSTAQISGSLDSRATVRTSSLTVQAGIAGNSEIETHDLSCEGPLSAGKVTATGTTTIRGDVQCGEMRCEGDIELRGAMARLEFLRWIVPDGECRMSLRHASDEMASVYMPLPEVLVEEHGEGKAAPTLDLGLNIGGIKRLRVDVPRISISVESIPKGATVDFAEDLTPRVGLRLKRRDVEISLQTGVLLCSLPAERLQPFSVDCARKSVLVLSGFNDHLPEVHIQGGGRVSLADLGPDASIGTAHVVGPTTLACEAPISELRMEPWSLEEGLRLPAIDYTVPKIDVAAGVVVQEASGGCVLEHLGARIRGVEKPRKRRGTSQFAVYDIATRLDVTESAGHLTDVDVSHLDADKIEYLTEPRVLEISGRTVRRAASERTPLRCLPARILQALGRTVERLAGEGTRSRFLTFLTLRLPQAWPSLSRDEIRERAERIARLSDVVGRRVNSGNSRAWLNWSIARLQHRGLRLFAYERLFRSAFRVVGYGYRPGPAFLTWVATAAMGLVYAWWHEDPAKDPVVFGWSMFERLGEFMFLPIGYLQFADANGALSLTPPIADIGIRVLIGVPFLFMLLSLRQYFRTRSTK